MKFVDQVEKLVLQREPRETEGDETPLYTGEP